MKNGRFKLKFTKRGVRQAAATAVMAAAPPLALLSLPHLGSLLLFLSISLSIISLGSLSFSSRTKEKRVEMKLVVL